MATWWVEYRTEEGKNVTRSVEVPDQFSTAQQVRDALESGQLPDVFFEKGRIYRVERIENR